MKKFASVLGIAACIALIIFGINTLSQPTGSTADYTSFGGDAYTYIYRATRYTANNVVLLNENLNRVFGGLSVIGGIIGIAFFLIKLSEASSTQASAATTAPTTVTAPVTPDTVVTKKQDESAPTDPQTIIPEKTDMSQPASPGMWRCLTCGTENSDSDGICKKCGTFKSAFSSQN